MRKLVVLIGLTVALILLCAGAYAQLPPPGQPGAVNDPRYCGEPRRADNGKIYRDRAELRKFAKVFPCPSTLNDVPSCPGWAIDHTIPLADGGCDSVANMSWLPDPIKSCAGTSCKDRWERKYHATPRQAVTGQ